MREKYWWPHDSKDVQKFYDKCEICKMENITPKLEHPAIAIEVGEIFDRIQVDLVFGLPKTSNGFVGILVIIEALSKYPIAYPVRSKSAAEISGYLWNFICMFGPPKLLLSDNGKEFVNNLVIKML